MQITNEQIKEILSEMKEKGYDVGLRDLSYAILSRFYVDRNSAFRVVFGENADLPFDMYDASEKAVAIEEYMADHFFETTETVEVKQDEGMSFDEIKKGLIEDMNALIVLRDSVDADGVSVLEPKEMATVVGRIADIRSKLVEKFGTTEKSEEQRVVVMNKYNSICPYCGREVSVK